MIVQNANNPSWKKYLEKDVSGIAHAGLHIYDSGSNFNMRLNYTDWILLIWHFRTDSHVSLP